MNDLLIATMPLVGVVLGALLHSWFARLTQEQRHIEVLRAEAYADYLRAVAAAGHLLTDVELRDALRDAADAKSRIAIYGSNAVVGALARFEETGRVLSDPESTSAFISLVAEMRSKGGRVPSGDLELVLFGEGRKIDSTAKK